MKKLLFLIIVGGLVYLNYTNPTREDHEELLLAEMQALGQFPRISSTRLSRMSISATSWSVRPPRRPWTARSSPSAT